MTAVNRFEHIEHMPLRVYNRVVTMHNLLTDVGQEAMMEYVHSFSEDEVKQMFLMNTHLLQNGKEATHKFVTKDLNVEYNVGEVEDDVTIH